MVIKNSICFSCKIWMFFFIYIQSSSSSEGEQCRFKMKTTIQPFLSLFFFIVHDLNCLFVYRYSLCIYLCVNPLMYFNHVNYNIILFMACCHSSLFTKKKIRVLNRYKCHIVWGFNSLKKYLNSESRCGYINTNS